MVEQGFSAGLADRTGTSISSGGDSELCLALRLAGWRLSYDPRLRLRHYLPSSRLEWDYLRRLRRAFGASSVVLDAYRFAAEEEWALARKRVKRIWLFQMASAIIQGIALHRSIRHMGVPEHEGSDLVLKYEWNRGRTDELWRQPLAYGRRIRKVRRAQWHRDRAAMRTLS